MAGQPGDLTRQWWNLFQTFPIEDRDDEIAQWVVDRRVGALVALFEDEKQNAREALRSLRRRYPTDYARARRQYRGDYDWESEYLEDDDLTDRQRERREEESDRREAEYEWVEEQYQKHVFVLEDRSRIIRRLNELQALEGGGDS